MRVECTSALPFDPVQVSRGDIVHTDAEKLSVGRARVGSLLRFVVFWRCPNCDTEFRTLTNGRPVQ